LEKVASLFTPSVWTKGVLVAALVASTCSGATAQSTADANQDLVDSVKELRAQVAQLREAVSDIKAQAVQYRSENEQLRSELQALRTTVAAQTTPPAPSTSAPATANSQAPATANSQEQRIAALEENTQMLQSQVSTQYQTKVESGSKYRVRFSGLVLLNIFSNHGAVDNLDFPSYAASTTTYGSESNFGATLRQSEFGLEVFGPQIAGAKTSGNVQFDFGGGFPTAALDGVNTGLVRLRTATARMDWENTSLIGGQDSLFISPNSPTSFASLAVPSLGYAGNLWAWTPQFRVEHRIDLGSDQNLTVQAGILDNITGERSYSSMRQPQAGEASGQPAYAIRTGWNGTWSGNPAAFGVSGYYSKQNWGGPLKVNGWAVTGDWRIPISRMFELSGEAFRGRAIGGIGGGVGQSVIFSADPLYPGPQFAALDSVGGWSQLKYIATPKLEFNGAFGMDNPFASEIRGFVLPSSSYQTVIMANRGEMVNFIYRPRSDLLFSGEYRHLRTTQVNALNSAEQVNLMMGVLF